MGTNFCDYNRDFYKKLSLEDWKGGVKAMQGRVGIKEKAVRWNLTAWVSVIRVELDNIVVTKLFSEYCNAALSIVHELHTALFQCSSPLFQLGITKLMKKNDNNYIYAE